MVGWLLKEAREYLGLTIKEIAAQLNVTEFEIRRIERDESYNEILLQMYEKLLSKIFSIAS